MRGIFDTANTTDRDDELDDDCHDAEEARERWHLEGMEQPKWAFRQARLVRNVDVYVYTVIFVCGCMAEQATPHGAWAPLPHEGCAWHAMYLPGDDDVPF